MTRTRDERETAIILSDSGTCTVWTTSPVVLRRLRKRLGEPHYAIGECRHWILDPETHSIPLPRRRGKRRKPPIGRQFSTKQPPEPFLS
jgi:hypothetical protein